MKTSKKKKVIDIYPPHYLEKNPPTGEEKENIMIRIESTPLSMVEEEPEKISLEEEKYKTVK